MNDSDINDIRSSAEFKGVSFSKFQKLQVKKQLVTCIVAGKVEAACNWSAELICAGQFLDVWECILLLVGKYIHSGNPKLPIYITMRFKTFKEIMSNGYLNNELAMRNNPKIRQLFAEVVCVLCYSRKKHSLEQVKILKAEEFSMTHMANRLKAPDITYGQATFKADDPKELFIAVNEFAYHVSKDSKNNLSACYWLEWILEYLVLCLKRKEKCCAETRAHIPVLDKYKKDIIWIIWDALFYAADLKKDPLVTKTLHALLDMFTIKYSDGMRQRRRFLIYFAIAMVTDVMDFSIEMVPHKQEVEFMTTRIDVVYKAVKKNEMAPKTDYLYEGLKPEKSNLDKTQERLEIMNGLMWSIFCINIDKWHSSWDRSKHNSWDRSHMNRQSRSSRHR